MARTTTTLKYDWKFTRDALGDVAGPTCDEGNWQTVRVPHDWAIAGPFDIQNDRQLFRILEDGDQTDDIHTGRTGGLPHVGDGFYRKSVFIPAEDDGKHFRLEFDGVMSNAVVHVNGCKVGAWPYGYTSFAMDITDRVVFGRENLIAVSVHNDPCSSRWHPGAGIYRHVRLLSLAPIHIAYNGVAVTPRLTGADSADVQVELDITMRRKPQPGESIEHVLLNAAGQMIVSESHELALTGSGTDCCCFAVSGIERWTLEEPTLYTLRSIIKAGDQELDTVETSIGFRDFQFDKDRGFSLNGVPAKLKGVCMHHDLGALGTAVNTRAIERQLEILKNFGTNALRTSHNPPTPELLDLCDRMGVLVMDEAFDEWRTPKLRNGYAHLWANWAEQDLSALIKRDRNHPCVIMWSIGNEVPDQHRADGGDVAGYLADICHRLDPTRPVTCGFNGSDAAISNGLADAVDVPGWNYKPHLYQKYHREHPDYCMVGAETASTVSSRGVYKFPVSMQIGDRQNDLQVSSYDLYFTPWATLPESEFAMQRACEFVAGEFVWTGFDYLGEPTPFKSEWPSRSSYFGIVDLCGFAKDRTYLYAAEWGSQPVLHLYPHWNWEGREGQNTPVFCVTTDPSAELFLNGRSLGKRHKGEFAAEGIDFSADQNRCRDNEPVIKVAEHISTFRLIWDDVPYEPGTLKVVAFDEDGQPAAEKVVETSGVPAGIDLSPDRPMIAADGDDLCFVTVRITDDSDRFVPTADSLVEFAIAGPAEIIAVDNGDATSLEPFQATARKAFNGMCLVVIRSMLNQPGEIVLTASSEALSSRTLSLKSQ